MEARRPSFVVGIGGSAGGVEAFQALLNALPSKSGMAFIFVGLPGIEWVIGEIIAREKLVDSGLSAL